MSSTGTQHTDPLCSWKCENRRHDQDPQDDRARLQSGVDRLFLHICQFHDSFQHHAEKSPTGDVDGVFDDVLGNCHDVPWLGANQGTTLRLSALTGSLRKWFLPRGKLPLDAVVLQIRVPIPCCTVLVLGDSCGSFLWITGIWY